MTSPVILYKQQKLLQIIRFAFYYDIYYDIYYVTNKASVTMLRFFIGAPSAAFSRLFLLILSIQMRPPICYSRHLTIPADLIKSI